MYSKFITLVVNLVFWCVVGLREGFFDRLVKGKDPRRMYSYR